MIKDIECILPDMNGISRGKIHRADKIMQGLEAGKTAQQLGIKLPESIFGVTLEGDFTESTVLDICEPDLYLYPDISASIDVKYEGIIRNIVVCDAYDESGKLYDFAPRTVLKNIISQYDDRGLRIFLAPEIELYFTPKDQKGRESFKHPYGGGLADDFDRLLRTVKQEITASGLTVDIVLREGGAGQVEINVDPLDALGAADQVFLMKRIIKEAAATEGYNAIFMAKPFDKEPASALHIHQSLYHKETGDNIFVTSSGDDSDQLSYFIAGLQKYIPSLMPLLAPNLNSYRRFRPYQYAPLNVHWARENRTVGIRVPQSDAKNRRVENRIAGADVNPYLAIAASLAAGLLGLKECAHPDDEMTSDANDSVTHKLPRHMLDGLERMKSEKKLKTVFPENFLTLYHDVKEAEYDESQARNTPWENDILRRIL